MIQTFAVIARSAGISALLILLAGCGPSSGAGSCSGDYCGTVVFAAPGEPTSLLPAVTDEALDRDIFDRLFLKLADLGPDGGTFGDSTFVPQLASSWVWLDSLTLAFHLDPRARWHDDMPVTASDVAFTFASYTDSLTDSPYRGGLEHVTSVTVRDSSTAVFTFNTRSPEMFFDAVYSLRILPEHLLADVPHDQWASASFGRSPVGSGPYRFVSWTSGQSVELAADSTFFLGRPHIRRLIWRFTADLSVAVTQVVAGEADAIQVLVTPDNLARAEDAEHLTLYPYPGSVYTVLGLNLRANGDPSRPHPIFGDRDVRRALVLGTDRHRMATSIFGEHAKVPPAPIPEIWQGLWFEDLPVPDVDTAAAARLLDARGWHTNTATGFREKDGVRLTFRVAVPSTSGSRKAYAQVLQEQFRLIGAEMMIDQMESATMQESERTGHYDAAIESWGADPSPRAVLAESWTSTGAQNFGHYANPAFDAAVADAVSAPTASAASAAWRRALGILADDVPAIVLYSNDNVAAIDSRIIDVRLRPDDWWADVWQWRIPADRLAERDRVVR